MHSVLDGYGIEKSSVSREFVQASAAQLKKLCEKNLAGLELVAILIDGIHLGKQVLVVALGIESSGKKHVLGLWQGATENTVVVKDLLEDLVTRGLDAERRYLFVIDGAKALRAAIERVFGERAEVQRCQLHKRRNVAEYLPKNAQGDYDRRIRNAYATGQALFALRSAGAMSASDPVIRNGVNYLLRTQASDASCHVKTRAIWLQPYLDSGFPYGKDQFISTAGTAWATLALTLAAEPARQSRR